MRAQLTSYQVDGIDVVPLTWDFTEDQEEPGTYVAALWPNTRGPDGTQYLITADAGDQRMQAQFHTITEGLAAAAIAMTVNPPPWPPVYAAQSEVATAKVLANSAGSSASIAMTIAKAFGNVDTAIGEARSAADEAKDAATQAGAIRYKTKAEGILATEVDGYFRVERGGLDGLERDTLFRRTAAAPYLVLISTAVDGTELDALTAEFQRLNEQRLISAADSARYLANQSVGITRLSVFIFQQ